MKKNCNGCRALMHLPGSQTGIMQCSLGFETKPGKEITGITVSTIPVEDCPKPTTYTQYFNLKINTQP